MYGFYGNKKDDDDDDDEMKVSSQFYQIKRTTTMNTNNIGNRVYTQMFTFQYCL
jgi:hypothetical protein